MHLSNLPDWVLHEAYKDNLFTRQTTAGDTHRETNVCSAIVPERLRLGVRQQAFKDKAEDEATGFQGP